MADPRWNTAIIGAGPVGLATALIAARRGRSLVISRPRLSRARAFRIDSVPAPLLALLVELGLHPARLGVEEFHDHRLIAWEGAEPRIVPGAATVHLMRPLLEEALLELARRSPNITLEAGRFSAAAAPATLCLDATGRASVSASRRIVPDNPAMCSVFALRGAFSKAQQAFRMAATPYGYVYRSGVAGAMVLGVVQGRREWATPIRDLARYLRAVGADWLVTGLDAGGFVRAMGGAACVQWNVGPDSPIRIGDAAWARDPLSSQGISNGISDGLKACDAGAEAQERYSELRGHIGNLRRTISACRYADSPYWSGYASALDDFERRIASLDAGSMRNPTHSETGTSIGDAASDLRESGAGSAATSNSKTGLSSMRLGSLSGISRPLPESAAPPRNGNET
jgi:hypothetical protein